MFKYMNALHLSALWLCYAMFSLQRLSVQQSFHYLHQQFLSARMFSRATMDGNMLGKRWQKVVDRLEK